MPELMFDRQAFDVHSCAGSQERQAIGKNCILLCCSLWTLFASHRHEIRLIHGRHNFWKGPGLRVAHSAGAFFAAAGPGYGFSAVWISACMRW